MLPPKPSKTVNLGTHISHPLSTRDSIHMCRANFL